MQNIFIEEFLFPDAHYFNDSNVIWTISDNWIGQFFL